MNDRSDTKAGLTGILVMAYGTASGPDDVERYYTDIRGGRPPAPEHLRELLRRYAAIGDRFPLLDITRRQARALERALNAEERGSFRSYLGMKHSPPFIPQAVAQMGREGIERAVGLVMAPHWSGMSIETYVERVEKAQAETGVASPRFTFIRAWYDHPLFLRFLASRTADALDRLPAGLRQGAAVVFSAHSLPVRELPDGSRWCRDCAICPEAGPSCRYVEQLRRTADWVGSELGLRRWAVAWQSAGRTPDPWWGPSVEDVIGQLATEGHPAVVVCSAGFVADHLEILYDLDIEAREAARRAGMGFERTEMPNGDPRFVAALAAIVRDHLAADPS